MYDPQTLSKIAIWRQKMQDGSITEAEYIEAVLVMREGRKAALQASDSSKRKKATVAIPSADSLLAGL